MEIDTGELYTWGDDKSKQLGHPATKTTFFRKTKRTEEQSFPRKVRFFSEQNISLKRVACGSQHMLALTGFHFTT